ncbi:DEKNAAC102795 [Brettanomyces naardenensis]|uniref:DEKNAAC102795 n=1 Tax=Brettanomyces naardenensis TaxID=13370 RepID=A0A448YKV0_BRENA|nr:DEKNAAC102795 [Brettanomyces naardenensis]
MNKFESGPADNAETPKLTNPYNDAKVLETITPTMRSYMLDTLTNHPIAYQPNASPSVGTSGAGGHRKSIAIAVKSTVKTPPTYSSSVSKINHYQAGITNGFKVRQKAETARQPLVVSPLPSSHSVGSSSDSSDASEESSEEDEFEDFEDYSDHNGNSSKNMPMRIQQRQLAIQNMMNPSKDAGNAWMKYAADEGKKQEGKERVLEDSIESLIRQERENSTDSELSSSQTTIIWSKVGINQRNSYEEISNDLRSLIMFNKKPMMKSIERYARSTAAKDKKFYRAVNEGQKSSSPSAKYLDKHGHFSCRAGSQLSKDLWGKANREYRVDRYHSTL